MKSILICGDSFAADWTPQHPQLHGWVNLLASEYDVTNLAQAGVGEYKILKQVRCQDLSKYDAVIVVHTSPNRVHVNYNPLHKDSVMHKDCDFIFADIIDSENKSLIVKAGIDYFKYVFDTEYYADIHSLMYDEIARITTSHKTLHLSFFEDMSADKNLYKIFQNHGGTMNHLSAHGNQLVYDEVRGWLKSVC